jgi:transposase
MSERLVNVDRDTPMLLPADLREWVPADDLVHFVISAIETMKLPSLKVNPRGSGSPQYPPRMMLALMIYCYANGMMASRRIERATYRDLAVRYLTADTHPDHDTICAFRRENGEAIKQAFLEILHLARQMGMLKVGTVSVDGTHIKANASKHKGVRYDRAGELEQKLRQDIEELMGQAEKTDREGAADEQKLPAEISRREALLEKMRWARAELEKRARGGKEPPEDGEGSTGGASDPPKPEDRQQINLTDPESSLMRKSRRDSYEQAYNAQAVVDVGDSRLILGTDVLRTPNDTNQLSAALRSVDESLGPVQRLLADGGYVNAEQIEVIGSEVDLYVAITSEDTSQRRYEYRPPRESRAKKVTDPRLVAMREKVTSDEGRRIYSRRACTVEPTFGTIKAVLGLRQFLMRGLQKVRIEWDLACLAYNVRRIWGLKTLGKLDPTGMA